MRKIGLRNIKIGMIIASNVYSSSGSIVIPAKTVLQQVHIDRLRELGVRDVLIEDPRVRDLDVPESITDDTRVAAISLLKRVFQNVASASRLEDIEIPYTEIRDIVSEIEEDLAASKADIVSLIECPIDDYLVFHSLNVAILSVMVARRSGLGSRVLDIGTGALLHDVAMPLIPKEVTRKKGTLTDSDLEVIRKHPTVGLKILRQISSCSAYVRAIVYQHQERYDGSGYPRGLRGEEIDPLARIVAVADTYCAMVEPRPHRDPYPPQYAYEYMLSAAGFEFDHQTVQGCLLYLAPYPVGSMVRLNTGEKGVVTHVSKGLGTRPMVRVFYDAQGKTLAKTYDLDLSAGENQTRLIAEVCDD